MDMSEEIPDVSPCFIVPNSQASENEAEENAETALKGLTTLKPLTNKCLIDQKGIQLTTINKIVIKYESISDQVASESSESAVPSSSSSDAHSQETSSLTSSKEDLSGEKQARKEHPLRLTRFERETNVTHENIIRTSTPNMVSSVLSPCKTVQQLTPVEHNSTDQTPQQEALKEKETSSSDDFVSPSVEEMKEESSVEEPDKDAEIDLANNQNSSEEQKDDMIDLDKDESSAEEQNRFAVMVKDNISFVEGQDKDGVIDLTNESSAEEQNKDMVKNVSSTETQNKDELIQEGVGSEGHRSCNNQLPKSNIDKNKDQTWNSLPRWVQNMTGEDRISPSIETITRTSSDVSTASSREISSRDSFIHQWQSENNDVDCGMIETNHDSLPSPDNQQEPSVPQQGNPRSLSPPMLSQDMFHPHPKGVAVQTEMTEQQSCHNDNRLTMEKPCEPSQEREATPADDVILPSQEELLCLHLTQSQSSSSPSQRQSQHEKQTSPLIMDRLGQREKDRITICSDVTPPIVNLSDTVLVPTPMGQPSTTCHHQDITENKTVTGQATRVSSDNSHSTRENDAASRADSKINESTESIESGVVGFHFSPPVMLLKPVPRSSPPCLVTNVETIPEEIGSTSEFRPVSPDLITTSPDRYTTISEKIVPIPTLSLSAPVPYEENTDGQTFHLQKDVLANIPIQPTAFARSVFTNVRERFQPAMASSPDNGIDPFEFTDEILTSPFRKRKRKSRRDKSCKKRKGRDNDGIMGDNEDQVRRNGGSNILESDICQANEQPKKECFWKIVQTKVIKRITTSIETETKLLYTARDGAVIKEVLLREFSEPTYKTITEENETKEEVGAIPMDNAFGNVRDNVENSHIEILKDCEDRSETSSSDKLSIPGAEKNKDMRTTDIAQLTKDCSDISTTTSTSNTTSPPLFPESSHSSSTSTSDFTTRKISNPGELISSPRKKYNDNQRTSRRSSNSPRVLHETPRMLDEGTRVLALWYDKHYYPGRVISKCNDDSKYRIEFDDGDRADIREQCVIVVDYLPFDQPVMFCEKARGEYVDGVIKGFYKNVDERGYKVLREDIKRVVLCPRKNVMLSTEQAAIFLSLRDSAVIRDDEFTLSFDKSPTLDRGVVTKVARESHEKSTKKKRSCQKDSPRKPLMDKNRKRKVQKKKREKRNIAKVVSEKGSPEEKNKKENIATLLPEKPSTSETPKSSRKSSGGKFSTKSSDNVGIQNKDVRANHVRRRLSTVINISPNKTNPIPLRSSPRKVKTVIKNENLTLPTNKDLFRGYGFILTGSDVIDVSNENSPQEEDHTFVREHVRMQITTGGGEVLKQFLEDYPSTSCFLLSNACQTTAKYFNALVLGVPCLSHAWIRDCCLENRLISYRSYLLPAGKDLITQCLVEEQNYKDALRGIKVHLVGEEEFRQHWTEVLNDAGCKIIKKLPANILQTLQRGEDESVCDVIVVGDGEVVHSTIQKSELLGIPTVTIHWVKQCILTGERVDFYAHESFIYRLQDK